MSEIEKALYAALMQATKACQRHGYSPAYTVQMIYDTGACQRMLSTTQPSDGFSRLWELRALELATENIAVRSEFAALLTQDERTIRRQRLHDCGYFQAGVG